MLIEHKLILASTKLIQYYDRVIGLYIEVVIAAEKTSINEQRKVRKYKSAQSENLCNLCFIQQSAKFVRLFCSSMSRNFERPSLALAELPLQYRLALIRERVQVSRCANSKWHDFP
jgi:hypothetical protein